MFVPTPKTLLKNSGKMLTTISLEMSIKKLVRLTAQTLRGSARQPFFGLVDVALLTPTYPLPSNGNLVSQSDCDIIPETLSQFNSV